MATLNDALDLAKSMFKTGKGKSIPKLAEWVVKTAGVDAKHEQLIRLAIIEFALDVDEGIKDPLPLVDELCKTYEENNYRLLDQYEADRSEVRSVIRVAFKTSR